MCGEYFHFPCVYTLNIFLLFLLKYIMVQGYIFDVYPDYQRDVMVTWLLTKNGAVSIKEVYHPSFYVYSSFSRLQNLSKHLRRLSQIHQVDFKKRKVMLGSDREKTVLEVTPSSLSFFHWLTKQIDSWGAYHIYQLYNVDIRLPIRYLLDRDVFFNAYVTWDGRRFIRHDDAWATEYSSPEFKTATWSMKQSDMYPFSTSENPIVSITVDDAVICEDNEVDTILSAVNLIQKIDPDILFTRQGDSILFPFLLNRAEKQGIQKQIILGRDAERYLTFAKQESSYFSYGRILHRPAFYMLSGRAHIDTAHSFFHGEGGMYGLVDLSRCSNLSFQLLSRLGPGTAISQIQVNKALQKGFLIPWKKTIPEMWKTAADLLLSDRGGLILDPSVGIHEQVIELDFASLYPTIMILYNISPETVLCPCCPHSSYHVPQLGYHICMKQKGLLPEVLQPILDRRFLFKARSRNSCYDQQRYAQLQQTWKWVLIVCFGYTGYKNARYGRIECHESITAASREILISAMHLSEQQGYEVLHGIVDSLWIKPKKPLVTPLQLARMIGQKTRVRIEVEGTYHWIVFLPNKGTGVGALNRYYGVFDDDTIKTRGIEARQHNTPSYFKNVQQQILRMFSQTKTIPSFQEHIPHAIKILTDAGKKIYTHAVSPEDLVFTTRVSKQVSSYKVNTVVKAALQQLNQCNVQVQPGQLIRYVVQHNHAKHPFEKVCIQELITHDTPIDVWFYLRFLAQCGETLLSPFGYTKEMLETLLFTNWKNGDT